MTILSFLTDPPVVRATLLHLELPHLPPPISPARGPPQGDFLLDQAPAFDPGPPRDACIAWGRVRPTAHRPRPTLRVGALVCDQSLPDHFDH
jgi:hypothetical protein